MASSTRPGEYHLYLTNIPSSAERPGVAAYRARWLIELAFAELKGDYGLDQIPTSKKSGVEVFLYASIITMLASHRLLLAVRRGSPCGRCIPAPLGKVFRAFALDILRILVRRRHCLAGSSNTMLHEAVDPHLCRLGLLQQAEKGIGYAAPTQ